MLQTNPKACHLERSEAESKDLKRPTILSGKPNAKTQIFHNCCVQNESLPVSGEASDCRQSSFPVIANPPGV